MQYEFHFHSCSQQQLQHRVTTATMSKHRNRPLAVCFCRILYHNFCLRSRQWTCWFTRSLSEQINNKKKNTNHSHEYAIDSDGIRFCVFRTGRRIGIFGHTMESVSSDQSFTLRAMPICVMVNHWHIGICIGFDIHSRPGKKTR